MAKLASGTACLFWGGVLSCFRVSYFVVQALLSAHDVTLRFSFRACEGFWPLEVQMAGNYPRDIFAGGVDDDLFSGIQVICLLGERSWKINERSISLDLAETPKPNHYSMLSVHYSLNFKQPWCGCKHTGFALKSTTLLSRLRFAHPVHRLTVPCLACYGCFTIVLAILLERVLPSFKLHCYYEPIQLHKAAHLKTGILQQTSYLTILIIFDDSSLVFDFWDLVNVSACQTLYFYEMIAIFFLTKRFWSVFVFF